MKILLKTLALAAVMTIAASATWAQSAVLLEVTDARSGQIVREYTMEDLTAMPQVSFETQTRWTEGVIRFTGVSLYALLQDAGVYAEEGSLVARALNDYQVDIPMDALEPDAPIVAYLIDGAPFSVRENGPLWVVYPYDRSVAYQQEVIYTRSIWQLVSLTVDTP